jgi:hypothetical protein
LFDTHLIVRLNVNRAALAITDLDSADIPPGLEGG